MATFIGMVGAFAFVFLGIFLIESIGFIPGFILWILVAWLLSRAKAWLDYHLSEDRLWDAEQRAREGK